MKFIELLKEFLLIFAVSFVVVAAVTYLYSLLIHSDGVIDWATAFRTSLTFGIVFTWLENRKVKN
jgi:hypothetical protein